MRLRTLLLTCLAMQAFAWILILGHRSSLSLAVAQSLFAVPIPYQLSMALVVFEAAVIVLSGAAFAGASIRAAGRWLIFGTSVQREPGICARCGYDMRSSPIQCPECGMVVENYRTPVS